MTKKKKNHPICKESRKATKIFLLITNFDIFFQDYFHFFANWVHNKYIHTQTFIFNFNFIRHLFCLSSYRFTLSVIYSVVGSLVWVWVSDCIDPFHSRSIPAKGSSLVGMWSLETNLAVCGGPIVWKTPNTLVETSCRWWFLRKCSVPLQSSRFVAATGLWHRVDEVCCLRKSKICWFSVDTLWRNWVSFHIAFNTYVRERYPLNMLHGETRIRTYYLVL